MDLSNSTSQPGEFDVSSLRVSENKTLRAKTFEALQVAIWEGHLKPGSRLVERDLCQMTGVSRSSIREALRYLESEGLVESRGIKGVFVRTLSPDVVVEIYEVQSVLGSEAASQFCERASDAEIDAIASAYAAMKSAQAADEKFVAEQINRFVDALFAGARNSVVENLMASLRKRARHIDAASAEAAPRGGVRGAVGRGCQGARQPRP